MIGKVYVEWTVQRVQSVCTVVEDLGMYLVVDYETRSYPSNTKEILPETSYLVILSGRKIVANPNHPHYSEMDEWDREDRANWNNTIGEEYHQMYLKYLSRMKK